MVAAAIIGSAVVGGVATTIGAKGAGKAVTKGAQAGAAATLEATALQVAESGRQFDAQMELLLPLILQQFGAAQFFGEILGFGDWDAESGTWSGGGPSDMGFGQEGGFFDPNLNPQQFGQEDWRDSDFAQYVQESQLAGETPEDDLAIQRVEETQFGTNYQDDPRYQRAIETGDLVGTEFQESPGYQFALEQMGREVDRKFSAGGGNYGGRAILESQRRAKGLADEEYYNWLGQRRQDLGRTDQALDTSVRDARRREELNVGRGDAALDDYFRRRAGDVGRTDQALLRNQNLALGDRQRQDQGYYNFLNLLRGGATTGAVGEGVAASSREGAANIGAYGNQGASLSRIWESLGNNRANISMGEAAGWNNAIQGGVSNWMFADYAGLFD